MVAGNSMLYRLLSLFLYLRWSIVDPARREVRVVTRWFWLFRTTRRIRFADVKEITTACPVLSQGNRSFMYDSTESVEYEVYLTARDGMTFRLASFVGSGGSGYYSRFDQWINERVNKWLPPAYQSYYAYYDRVAFLIGSG